MKFYISVDIEGISGIAHWDETNSNHGAYSPFQKRMINELNAVILAINEFDSHAQILVRDAHGSARNLIHDELPENVKLIRGWTGHPFMMMDGIDESFDGAFFVGYHTGTSMGGSPLSHNITRECQIFINDKIMTEFDLNAMVASYVKVPVLFISGDEQICQIAKKIVPQLETASVHRGVGNGIFAEHPKKVLRILQKSATTALNNLEKIPLYPMSKNFELKIIFNNAQDAYFKSFFPGMKLEEENTLCYKSDDYLDIISRTVFLTALTHTM